jgi:hypothetical protein
LLVLGGGFICVAQMQEPNVGANIFYI